MPKGDDEKGDDAEKGGINDKHHEAGTKDRNVAFEHGESQELERSKAKEPAENYSLKRELLANANSKLWSSATDVGEAEDDESRTMNSRSSRFASMIANLKSSGEAPGGIAAKSSVVEDEGTDDDHVFVAPKIVNELGQSIVKSSNDLSSRTLDVVLADRPNEAESDDYGGEKKIDIRKEWQDDRKGRFQVPQSAAADCTDQRDKATHISKPTQNVEKEEDHIPPMVEDRYDDDDDDEHSTYSNATNSISAESLGEYPKESLTSIHECIVDSSGDDQDSYAESEDSIVALNNERGESSSFHYEDGLSGLEEDERSSESILLGTPSSQELNPIMEVDSSTTKLNRYGSNNGAVLTCSKTLSAAPLELEKKGPIVSPRDLMRIYDTFCDSNHNHHETCHNWIRTHDNNSSQLLISLAQSELESEWRLKSSSGVVEGRLLNATRTIGNGNTRAAK